MERLKQLTEKLNQLTHEGATREILLEVGFAFIRELMLLGKPEQTDKPTQEKKLDEPEVLGDAVKSLNDTFNSPLPDLSSRLQQLRQDSLRSAMGINDRYIFLETLFKGDAHSFDTMMSLLDNATNFDQAAMIAAEYIRSVPDGADQAAVIEKFYELLRNRFSAI
jgi:hypothetical protein